MVEGEETKLPTYELPFDISFVRVKGNTVGESPHNLFSSPAKKLIPCKSDYVATPKRREGKGKEKVTEKEKDVGEEEDKEEDKKKEHQHSATLTIQFAQTEAYPNDLPIFNAKSTNDDVYVTLIPSPLPFSLFFDGAMF